MVESSSPEIFKTPLESVPDRLTQTPFPTQGLARCSFEVLSSLGCPMILPSKADCALSWFLSWQLGLIQACHHFDQPWSTPCLEQVTGGLANHT